MSFRLKKVFKNCSFSKIPILLTIINYENPVNNQYLIIRSPLGSVLKNYLIWRVVRSSIRMMDSRWSRIMQNFYKQNFGFNNSQANRTQFCYSLTYATFYHLIDHLYVKRKPELNKKQQVSFSKANFLR